MTVARYQTADFGANPFVLDAASVLGTGSIVPQFKLGHVAWGDAEAEYVYCKLVLAAATTMIPGDLYVWDDDFTATLLSTSNSPYGAPVGVGLVSYPAGAQAAAGTYYIWLMRAGQAPVRHTTITINKPTETTATAGACNSPSSATTSSKNIVGLSYTKALATFTATVTNLSNVLTGPFTGVSPDSGPFIGQVLSATGIAASQVITGFQYSAQGQITGIVLSANATVSGAAVTITPTLVGEARVRWPTVGITNP